MSMGSVLVQPQRIRRARRRPSELAIGSELAALVGRIAADGGVGGRVGTLALEVLQESVDRVVDQRRSRMDAALPRLLAWAGNLLRLFTGTGPDLGVGDARAGLRLARDLLARLADLLEAPAAATLRPHVAELVDIVENQLGLTPQDMLDEVWHALDRLAERLREEEPGESAAARAARLELVRMIRRLTVRFRAELSLPRLNPDRITAVLAGFLEQADARRFAGQLRCVADALGAFLDGAIAVTDLVELEAFSEFRSLGAAAAAAAADELYLWYPSWVLDADVVINRQRTEISVGDTVVRTGIGLGPGDLPHYHGAATPPIAFRKVGQDTCETVAWVTAVVRDSLQAFLHLISIERGDIASNVLNASFDTAMALGRGIARRPLLPWWAEHLFVWPLTFLASMEGMHTAGSQRGSMWLTLIGPDLGETLWYRYLTTRAREAILSGITLVNHQDAQRGDPFVNRDHVAGFADVFCFLFSLTMVACYPQREWSIANLQGGQTQTNWTLIFGWCLGGAWSMALLGRIVGGLLATALSRDFSAARWFTDRWYALFEHWFAFIAMLYMINDGRTDGGRYNPAGDAFNGYPDHASSPYTLPYPAGQTCYVGQSNQGLFSHNFGNGNQVYAYDFSLDQGDVILASRPGTVVSFMDTDPDDQNVNGGNFILIRHDRDDALNPAPADSDHDRGPAGRVDFTYALYLHGRQGSVTEFFPGGGIVGSRVQRGQRIMRSGSTGISFHNHLHMDVRQQPAGFVYADGNTVNAGQLTAPVPFVFRDVTNILGPDGVCTKLNWYVSSTEEVT
jgi:hypothetical protein